MIITVWNIRGLNDPSKKANVKQLLDRTSSDLICLLETRVKQMKCAGIQKKIAHGLIWVCNYSESRKGRIMLGWKNDRVHIDVLTVHSQFIHYRVNGNEVTDYEVRDFKDFIEQMSFTEIKTIYLRPSLSDHAPLMYEVLPPAPGKGKPFRFLNHMLTHPDFMNIVAEIWSAGSQGNSMSRIWKKCKNLKVKLKDLNTKEATAIEQLKYWRSVQESIYRKKARVQWVKLGDSNTKYFFSTMKQRQARNKIDSLLTEHHVLLKTPSDVEKEIVSFYKLILGSRSPALDAIDLNTMRAGKQLYTEAQNLHISPVTNSKIDCAIKSISDDKALGIDGFNLKFFKHTWDIVKLEIYEAVHDFFATGTLNT
ncbi:uncharacterized protein LOC110688652 [Chenopodium quinoa]|uniref:uncharacterized protein LOC110688652 n=1 Tax=Chenopodium quinoa TaxID=63459 RepID=UPI000B781FC8|nr:uncharacterized protein LOC110688652 [Chenopodium quinoa]